MKQKLTINETAFLDWFFHSDSDQDQLSTIKQLGYEAMDSLESDGSFHIESRDIFNTVEQSVIPIILVEAKDGVWNNKPEDGELSDLNFEYELELIK